MPKSVIPKSVIQGLTIILESDTPSRTQLAYEMALVQAALGGRASLFVTGRAVPTLATPDALCVEALAAGVKIIVCQAGLATHQLSMTDIDPRVEAGGLASLMQGLNDDRLVVV